MQEMIDKGVLLRKFEHGDIENLRNFRNDPEITRSLGGFSTGYSRADIAEWIEAHRQRADEVLFAITDIGSDNCIGHVGLYQIDYRTRKAEFAVLIGFREYQGRGIGKTVTDYMLKYGFHQLNLNKISLTLLANNSRALHVYESSGFVQEGIARQDVWRDGKYLDVITMSILHSEWRERYK